MIGRGRPPNSKLTSTHRLVTPHNTIYSTPQDGAAVESRLSWAAVFKWSAHPHPVLPGGHASRQRRLTQGLHFQLDSHLPRANITGWWLKIVTPPSPLSQPAGSQRLRSRPPTATCQLSLLSGVQPLSSLTLSATPWTTATRQSICRATCWLPQELGQCSF